MVTGQFPYLDSLIAADSTYMRRHDLKWEPVPDYVYDPTLSPNQSRTSASDSVVLDSLRQAKDKESREEMRRKEQFPLLTSASEHIQVGDTVYERYPGQRKFHPIETGKELMARYQRGLDSVKSLSDDDLIELLVKAPDSAALKKLDGISTNRTATAIPGTYRVWIKKGELDTFHKLGMGYEVLLLRPWGPPDSAESIGQLDGVIDIDDTQSSTSAQDIIFSESFSGSWPGPWIPLDENSQSSEEFRNSVSLSRIVRECHC